MFLFIYTNESKQQGQNLSASWQQCHKMQALNYRSKLLKIIQQNHNQMKRA